MRHDLRAQSAEEDATSEHLLWWPPTKVAGKYLASYIAVQEERELAVSAAPGVKRRAAITPSDHEMPLRGYEFVTR